MFFDSASHPPSPCPFSHGHWQTDTELARKKGAGREKKLHRIPRSPLPDSRFDASIRAAYPSRRVERVTSFETGKNAATLLLPIEMYRNVGKLSLFANRPSDIALPAPPGYGIDRSSLWNCPGNSPFNAGTDSPTGGCNKLSTTV